MATDTRATTAVAKEAATAMRFAGPLTGMRALTPRRLGAPVGSDKFDSEKAGREIKTDEKVRETKGKRKERREESEVGDPRERSLYPYVREKDATRGEKRPTRESEVEDERDVSKRGKEK